MGQGQSAEEAGACGYRVLGVQPNSPAAKADLVSFFDFVVAANNVPLRTLDSTFIEMIKGSNDRPLPLTIYNLKVRRSACVCRVFEFSRAPHPPPPPLRSR